MSIHLKPGDVVIKVEEDQPMCVWAVVTDEGVGPAEWPYVGTFTEAHAWAKQHVAATNGTIHERYDAPKEDLRRTIGTGH